MNYAAIIFIFIHIIPIRNNDVKKSLFDFRATGESTRDCSPDSEMLFDEMENDLEIEDLDTLSPSTNDPKMPAPDPNSNSKSLFFNDGIRSIDFVLCWKKLVNDSEAYLEEQRNEKRRVFERRLQEEGLNIEKEVIEEEITFVKVSDDDSST